MLLFIQNQCTYINDIGVMVKMLVLSTCFMCSKDQIMALKDRKDFDLIHQEKYEFYKTVPTCDTVCRSNISVYLVFYKLFSLLTKQLLHFLASCVLFLHSE